MEPRPVLRPIKIRVDAPQVAWAPQQSFSAQLVRAAIERKTKKRSRPV